jgi:hypothetical protein
VWLCRAHVEAFAWVWNKQQNVPHGKQAMRQELSTPLGKYAQGSAKLVWLEARTLVAWCVGSKHQRRMLGSDCLDMKLCGGSGGLIMQ